MPWHAVHTAAVKEELANEQLRDRGFETLFLHREVTIRHARSVREGVKRAYFPRYVFVNMPETGGRYDLVNDCPSVSTVIYISHERPLVVPDPIMAELIARGDKTGLVSTPKVNGKDVRERWEPGDFVKMKAGPLMGLVFMVKLDTGRDIRLESDEFRHGAEFRANPDMLVAADSP